MGIAMIVKKAFRPGGSGSKLLEPGSPFVSDSESQARLCRAMGWCEDAPPAPAAAPAAPPPADETPKRAYHRKVVEADTPAPAAKKTTRTYQRRDMTAEDD